MPMGFKAIIFDLDGTAIPTQIDGLPSNGVIQAVARAKKVWKVTAATGRSYKMAKPILSKLTIVEPCIISGGSQIVDPATGKIIWQKELSVEQVRQVIEICKLHADQVFLNGKYLAVSEINQVPVKSQGMIALMAVPISKSQAAIASLQTIADIAAHGAGSWTQDRIDIHVTHALATKKHALETLFEQLVLDKKDVIGVGDSDNDVPLFESVGYKIAMGNATANLKSRADLITKDIQNDGLAFAIDSLINST